MRALLLLTLVLLAGLATAPRANALESGMVADLTWGISRPDMTRSAALMRDNGAQWVRLNVNWSSAESEGKGQRSAYWLEEFDFAVRTAQAAGLKVLMPIADGVPYWASADPRKTSIAGVRSWNRRWRPTNFADYADFVAFVVARYSAMGVHAYEVWNEPNLAAFWPSGPSAAEYAEMLKTTAPRIRAADPSAKIVLGGLSLNDRNYLDALYAHGARSSFDAVGVHPYMGDADPATCPKVGSRFPVDALCGLQEMRAAMVAQGDSAKTIWVTEMGWTTSALPSGVTEEQQARYLTGAWEQMSCYPWVEVALWYALRNLSWLGDDRIDREAQYGLVRTDFSPKPALAAFGRAARQSTCGSTSTPSAPPAPSGAESDLPVGSPGRGVIPAVPASGALSATLVRVGRTLQVTGTTGLPGRRRVLLTLEQKSGSRWVPARRSTRTTTANGSFSWSLPTRSAVGTVRVRAQLLASPATTRFVSRTVRIAPAR